MSYSEDLCQAVIVAIVVCLLMLSVRVMRRLDQPESVEKTRKIPQEHDERFP